MSLSLDSAVVWSQASDFVNNLWPIFIIPMGIIFGVGLLNFILKTIRGALTKVA